MSELSDIWLSNLVIQSVIESSYSMNFEYGDDRWDLKKVAYYPVWSRDRERSKFLLRIMISFENTKFRSVTQEDLSLAGQSDLEDLYDTLVICNVKKAKASL